MKKRAGENNYAWFRSNRFYIVKDFWYFSTREGVDFGPFENQNEAQEALQSYIEKMNTASSATQELDLTHAVNTSL